MGEVEKSGVPTITFANRNFVREFAVFSETWGTPGLPHAVVTDYQFSLADDRKIQQLMESLGIDVLVDGLTRTPTNGAGYLTDTISLAKVLLNQEVPEVETFEAADRLEAWEKMNATFVERQWSDGLPLIAPTPEKVEQMLAVTRRSADDVVGVLEPGFGIATVQKIAINGVMAGCKPDQLPVLIAAVEAMTEPAYKLRQICTSTTAFTPLLWVNGPIRSRIGMNSGMCCLGPGAPSVVNTAIGRAVRLMLMNIAGSYAGITDPDSLGSPNKYSMCLAENEEASAWAPFHVDRGYRHDQSTVTLVCAASLKEWNDQRPADPLELIRKLAVTVCDPGGTNSWGWLARGHSSKNDPEGNPNDCLIIMLPNHARYLAEAGWTKAGTKEVLHLFARMPGRLRPGSKPAWNAKHNDGRRAEWDWLPDNLDVEVPMVRSPDNFQIVVAGGDNYKAMVVPGGNKTVTRLIDE